MMTRITFIRNFIVFFFASAGYIFFTAAKAQMLPPSFDLSLKTDTSVFTTKKDVMVYNGQSYLAVKVSDNTELAEITIKVHDGGRPGRIFLSATPLVSVIDSLTQTDTTTWKGLIQFENLLYGAFPSLNLTILNGAKKESYAVKILPYLDTHVELQDDIYDVLQEEERNIEIPVRHAFNVITDNIWYVSEDFDYKVSRSVEMLTVTIKPHTLGYKELSLKLKTLKPVLTEGHRFINQLPPVTLRFNVRPNQLYFLNSDKKLIYTEPGFRNTEEILLDYNKNISLKKIYRIEDQPEENGNLIAELIPVSIIENSSKILCRIRPYSLHRMTEGYLYIKENERARFITNFNIWERPKITSIFIRHEGEDWINSNNVFPGETVDVRLEGKGLENALIQFAGIHDVEKDTLRISDEAVYYRLKVPLTITSKNIPLIVNKKNSSFELYVKEYQLPAELNFISVNYGEGNIDLTNDKLNKPIFYEKALNEINFTFNPSRVDEKQKISGKQYLSIHVNIFNRKNDLIEFQQIDNVVVCPGDNSPRKLFYDRKDCQLDPISLNDYLIHKTYQLEPFSQMEITVTHNENKYGGRKGYSKKIKIILTRKIHFDVQVSFPAGLLVKKFNEPGYGNLSGISTSILAQFNFYNPKLIGKLRPYNIGAGFIALNAFNFSDAANILRDVGIVVLGSITPVRREAKFSLPIYAGGGYLLKANSWFLVFGPGIQLNF